MKWREGGQRSAYTKHHEGDVFSQPLDRLLESVPLHDTREPSLIQRAMLDIMKAMSRIYMIDTSQGGPEKARRIQSTAGNAFQ
jgi:hypothetical protein